MLTQGERPPDMRKLAHLYEEPGWVKATNEFTGLADAGRAIDNFGEGNFLGGLGSLAMASPVGPGKLGKLGKGLDDAIRSSDEVAQKVRPGDPTSARSSLDDRRSSTGRAGSRDRTRESGRPRRAPPGWVQARSHLAARPKAVENRGWRFDPDSGYWYPPR
jgi:hypothetical protein